MGTYDKYHQKEKRKCLMCPKEFIPTRANNKFCCRECYLKAVRGGMAEGTPESSFDKMSWEDISRECMRLRISYGKAQQMYYNGTLPEDFGKRVKG